MNLLDSILKSRRQVSDNSYIKNQSVEKITVTKSHQTDEFDGNKDRNVPPKVKDKNQDARKRLQLRAKLIDINRNGGVISRSIINEHEKSFKSPDSKSNSKYGIKTTNSSRIKSEKLFGPPKEKRKKIKFGSSSESRSRYICGVPQPIRNSAPVANFRSNIRSNKQTKMEIPMRKTTERSWAFSRSQDSNKRERNIVEAKARIYKNKDFGTSDNIEDDEDMDFISDSSVDDSWRSELRAQIGYDPRKYEDYDEECEVSGFDRLEREEKYSSMIGEIEDEEQLKLLRNGGK